jgi:hypothetical protein
MSFPFAQPGNKLFARQWRPPSSRVFDKPKMPEIRRCRLVFPMNPANFEVDLPAEVAEKPMIAGEYKKQCSEIPSFFRCTG